MKTTNNEPLGQKINPLAVASLTLGGAAIATLIAKKRDKLPTVNGHAAKCPLHNHDASEPVYILVSGQREKDDFSVSLNNWLNLVGDNTTTLLGYCVSISESAKPNNTNFEETVVKALTQGRKQLSNMSIELAELIAEAAKHTNKITVQCHQGTDLLGEKAVKLLPLNIQSKVELLSLGATLK